MALNLDAKLERLVKKQSSYKSDNFGCNLLISRMQKKYEENQSAAELKNCIQEMDAFLAKYSTVMAKDIEAIKNL